MRKIIEYRIVDEPDVDKRLASGYELYGSPLMHRTNGLVIQAMVKYEEEFRKSPTTVVNALDIVEAYVTPEMQFKQKRREYYNSFWSKPNERYELPDGKWYKIIDIIDIVDQEWQDHLDHIDDNTSRSTS